jgi:transporter family-2 protein
LAVPVVIAVLVGIVVSAQVRILGRESDEIPVLAVSFALLAAGLIGGSVWMTLSANWGELGRVAVRWWWLPLGIAGWLIVAALGFAAARIGVASTLAVSVAAQLTAGYVADVQRRAMAFTARPVAALILLMAGTLLLVTTPRG